MEHDMDKWEELKRAEASLLSSVCPRVSFELTYAHEPGRRVTGAGIDGGSIPDAFNPARTAPGEWCQDNIGEQNSEHDMIREIFRAAISEVIHEGLEWFRVDEDILLSPHGKHESKILKISSQCADELWSLVDREFSTQPHH